MPEVYPSSWSHGLYMLVSVFNEDAILLAHPVPTRASQSGQPCMGPMNGLWLWPRAFHFHKWHTSVKACAHCINRACMSPWSAIVDADISVQLVGSVLLSSPVLPAVLMTICMLSYACCHVVVLPLMLTFSSHVNVVFQPAGKCRCCVCSALRIASASSVAMLPRFHGPMCLQ